jgi:acyl-CoA synthetase (AMP-forming)/AMP-acid ligase II
MTTVYAAFERSARRYASQPFLHIPASALPGATAALELTYDASFTAVARLMQAYRARGYGLGHRVALLLENRPEALFHYFALNRLGASVVPLNPDYRPAELEYVIGHSEACLAVTLPSHVARFDALEANGLSVVVHEDAFDPPRARAPAGDGVPGRDTEAGLLYTSGTTGKPKGCILTNHYVVSAGEFYNAEGGYCRVREGVERLITPLPLFHMNALLVSTTAMILAGGCIVQLDRFHPKSWWADVRSSGATIAHYLGVMPAILMAQPASSDDRAHAIRFGFGANANPKDHAAFEARFGFPLIEAWAMTETGAGAWMAASREPRFVGTRCIGRPHGEMDVRVVDEHDRDVPKGEPGELLVRHRGPDPRAAFFSGYLKDPAATEHAWRGGWFHTGDAVRRGADGVYHFVDRRKNIIRRSGENIAALEVEAALADHPAIAQIAVIAVPDSVRDEEVMACVVPAAGAARNRETALAVQDQALARLAYFKAPGYVLFIDSVPTTATNKVQKAKLADFLGADAGMAALASNPNCFDLRDRKKRRTESA